MHLFQIPRKRGGLTALLALFWCLSIASPAQADRCNFSLRGADQICTLTWNNLLRQYLLRVPSSFVPGQSAILAGLHGSQGSGPTFEGSSLTAKSDQVGFAALYPSATNIQNNTGIWQFDGGNDDGSTWLWTERGATPPDDIGSTVIEASVCSVTSSGEVRRSYEVHHCSSLQQFCCAKILSPSLSANTVFVVFCARVMALFTDRRIDYSVEQRRRGSNA
jgi:hypothetical protein